MASRSSGGSGLVITVAILGVASLALFITTIVFLSKYQAANRNLVQMTTETEDFVRPDERQSDKIGRIKDQAKKGQPKKSVVGYLSDSLGEAMSRISGAPTDTVTEMTGKLEAAGITGSTLLAALNDRKAEIAALNDRVAKADAARTTAQQDMQNEVERNKKLQESFNKTKDSMNADIDKYKAEIETYRLGTNDAKKFMDSEIQKMKELLDSTTASMNEKNHKLEDTVLALQDQLSKLRASQVGNILKPRGEQTLVDGDIIAINQASNTVTISRGRDAKVILGMPFGVYGDATAIKLDPKTNTYPAPKATLEVINIGETSSTCRITSEVKGNPIVRGDVIANAVYDPNKVYTFLVYGNFDPAGTGIATPQGASDIKAMISAWGGKTVDDLSGNVDFLVLGERPTLPPPPGVSDPDPIVQNYMRLNDIAQRYDKLFETAAATSLPVLNQNRFYTLIGRRAGSR